MDSRNNFTDMVKAFGNQDYVIFEKDYMEMIRNSPLVNGVWTVGDWFSFVSNTHTWTIELVSGNSLGVIGYSHDEIITRNKEFITGFLSPEDFPFVNMAIQNAMQYVNSIPIEERPYVYLVFYVRCIRKDGTAIFIQNQNIPLAFDSQNIPYLFVNILTDISSLQPGNIPHVVMINKKSNQHFLLDKNTLMLKPEGRLFSDRELEIIHHLVRGLSSMEISQKLFISYETVRTHRKNILKKINANTTAELVRYVLMNKVV